MAVGDYTQLFEEAGSKHNVDPHLLAVIAGQETRGNPNLTSDQGAQGLMQIMPGTAKRLGINPKNEKEAIDGAARLLAESLDRNNGDVEQAVGEYHGGPDRKIWGPKNAAYRKAVMAAYASDAAPGTGADLSDDALLAAASGGKPSGKPAAAAQAPAADLSDDALLSLASGGKGAPGAPDVVLTDTPGAPPGAPRKDDMLGLQKGFFTPFDNAALWLEHGLDKFGGLGTGFNRFFGGTSVEDAMAQRKAYLAGQAAKGVQPGMGGEIAGNVLGTLPAMLATKNPMLLGGIGGALSTSDPLNAEHVAKDFGFGALAGKAADIGMNKLAGVVAPKFSSAVEKMLGEKISMTPGQLAGGFFKDVEDKLTSAPVIGSMINNARGHGFRDFFDASLNRVLGPINETLPAGLEPREALQHTAQTVSHAYDDLLTGVTAQADKAFATGMANAVKEARSVLPEARAKQVEGFLRDIVTTKVGPSGLMTGETLKAAESKLSNLIRTYGSKPDGDQQLMANVLEGAQAELRALVQRSNPQIAGPLKAANTAFANLVRVERAASSVGAEHGLFTPAQLLNAVKAADSSVRKRSFAQGTALMQDLAESAKAVLPNKVPESGTVPRALMNLLVGGGLAGGAAIAHAPGAIVGGLAAMAPYTRPAVGAVNGIARFLGSHPAPSSLRAAIEHLKVPAILAASAGTAQARPASQPKK